ncbi:MAG: GNAT family N-acetyltransferase [Parvularculales bacterium]
MSDKSNLQLRMVNSLREIAPERWDACAQPQKGTPCNPFLSHAFLSSLEESGSAAPETGWGACHVLLEDTTNNTLIGCVPLYLKGHSQGEYVFDYGWASAFEQAGGRYYPKLQSCVPFTPVPGRRLLTYPDNNAETIENQLLAGCLTVAEKLKVSSLHFTFLPKSQWALMGENTLLQRTDQQFHWSNEDYNSFDDFLTVLASRKRKSIRKERAEVQQSGLQIECLTGSDIKEHHWDSFFAFYMDTSSRKWGHSYLTRTFFSLIGERMADNILLVMAYRKGQPIAGSLNIIGSDCLYGRNWGCLEDHRFLHFEMCYYQAIEFAIAHRLKRVEAGAQGAHKLARGYLPTPTYSAHHIAHPQFREAVARYLDHEREDVSHTIEALEVMSPFRHDTLNLSVQTPLIQEK